MGNNTFCFSKVFGNYIFLNVFACGIPACALGILVERPDRRLVPEFNILTSSFIPALFGCFIAICIERSSRRGLLALYLSNLATETLYRMAVSRGIVTPLKNGEIWLFSTITAVYMYLFRKSDGLPNSISKGLEFIVGSDEACVREQAIQPAIPESDTASQVTQIHSTSTQRSLQSYFPPEVQRMLAVWRLGMKHRLCQHQHSCISSAVEQCIGLLWRGYLIQGAVKFLGAIPQLFKGKIHPIIKAITHKDNLHFGAFLGCFAGIFKIVSCILRWLCDKDSELHGLVSGFLAGWSMLWYRSSSIAMYLASKLAEAVFEPHNLRPAYWGFLQRLTNYRFGEMNRQLLDMFGTNASTLFTGFYPKYDSRYTNLPLQPVN